MLIDSHCHLTDPQFQDDRREVLLRARAAGVGGIVSICSHRADGDRIRQLLQEDAADSDLPRLWGTAGIHPHDAAGAAPDDLDALRALARSHPRVVAIGETGLDFHYDHSPRAVQEELFRHHLEMAEVLGLPVVVHSRSADPEMEAIVREWGSRVRGVLHCFTGGEELLRAALEQNWMISFTGIVTFRKFEGAQLLRSVPRDRMMVETDAPYLAPVPLRGRRNEPTHVVRVAETVALLREEAVEDVHAYTTANARRFFGLDLPD